MAVDVAPWRFDRLVRDAIDALPTELASAMQNVAIQVRDRDLDEPDLLGLYEGTPLTERGADGFEMPDVIFIYRLPICEMCDTEGEVVDEVRITVIHEIAHHFGIDDDRLEELGWD